MKIYKKIKPKKLKRNKQDVYQSKEDGKYPGANKTYSKKQVYKKF